MGSCLPTYEASRYLISFYFIVVTSYKTDKMPEGVGVGDVSKAAAMLDHFEKIQKLPDKLDGVPNFRRVPGYKVFCCGQPTKDGFIIWLNMRQEAIVYVNGSPVCARPPNKIGE